MIYASLALLGISLLVNIFLTRLIGKQAIKLQMYEAEIYSLKVLLELEKASRPIEDSEPANLERIVQ